MRRWRWSFWGVLALLFSMQTSTINVTTDFDSQLIDVINLTNITYKRTIPNTETLPFLNLSENFTQKEHGESNLLSNYTYMIKLSTNETSHLAQLVRLPLFTTHNESRRRSMLFKNENGRETRNSEIVNQPTEELEERLDFDRIGFEDYADNQYEDGDNNLQARVIEEASDYGLKMMHDLVNNKEPELYMKGLWLSPDSASGRVAAFNAPNPKVIRLARVGYAVLQASNKLMQQWLVSGGVQSRGTSALRGSLRGTRLQRQCRALSAQTPCRPAARRYRTADGSCNNPTRPKLGGTLTPLQRFQAPRYVDQVQEVRNDLPSARLVSTVIHRPRNVPSPSVTLMLMQWGQLVDHDITSTPGSRAFNGSTPRCCADGGRSMLPSHLLHPDCLPIPIPQDDPVLSRFGIRCMEFVRSAPIPRKDCDFGHRQQMNQVTSYLDASTIYGSSAPQADNIRLFRGGLIQFGLPDPPNGGEPCRMGAVSSQCLRPGDGRASEQPALTALHITWVQHHNQIASTLTGLNPHWSDEKLYQETRRLISAFIQHITYREFLPIILGHEVMHLFDLLPLHKGYYLGYDPRINPAPSNSFSAAAYRFGHSLVQSSFIRSDSFHRPIFNNVSLHDEQSNMENIWSARSIDRLILGLINQPSQKRDEFISVELTNHLFQAPGTGSSGFGLDLAAINIQRGRDHGLPPYTAWRQPCGLSPINNWTDLQRVMFPETADRFRSIFLSVDDIDLYSAGLAERPVRGGLVGPTFACIIAQQFSNLRKGDRFWYENGNFESSFTLAQLQQIRKITFAQIICDSMTEVKTLQPFVFLTPDNLENRREICTDLVDFDLSPWVENSGSGDNFVETKVEENNSTVNTTKEKVPKFDTQDDVFLFSMTSTQTDNKNRRFKRKTNKKDKLEHRQLEDPPLLTDQITLNLSRNERKRRPNRKSKPKSTPKPITSTIIPPKTKNKTKSDLKHLFYGQNYYPTNEEVLITKRPTNSMTYLYNTVRKTTTTTTPKSDYQFHIQINYFYNSTTETYPKPTKPTYNIRPSYNPSYNYDTSTPNYDRINYNNPNSYDSFYGPLHHTYTSDRIDFGQPNNRYPTNRPSSVSSNTITVIEFNPQTVPKPGTLNRPNIYIVNDQFNEPKPTYEYDRYNLPYQRPTPGHVTKLDSKPFVVYDHKNYGTEVLYDHEYLDQQRPIHTNINDKLDFNNQNSKPIYSTPSHLEDKKYIKISTVKGHTTQTDTLKPIYISVQNKESSDDLEMTFDDILEVYMKPSNGTQNKSNDRTVPKETPIPDAIFDECITELPRPLKLFLEDDLLGF